MKQLRIILILSCVLVTMVACKDRNKVDDNGNNYGSSTFKLGSLYYSFIGSDDVSVVAPPDYTPYSITYVSIDETIAYKNRTYYVWRIEHDAFAFDSNLITANTGEVRYIDDYAFAYCSNLTSVTLGNNIKELGDEVFLNCTSLTDIYIGNPTPPTITSSTFSGTGSWTVHVPSGSVNAYKTAPVWKDLFGGSDSGDNGGNNGGDNTSYTKCPYGFSIGQTETVFFSPGNLQYNASSKRWRFAPEQYNTCGSSNANISSYYSGWIDVFGWGTSGYSGYYPYLTSSRESDYYSGKTISNTDYDWGMYNSIDGDYPGTWHTMEAADWWWIFYMRNNASNLYGLAKVGVTLGLMLLPDGWTCPSGISFVGGKTGFYTSNTYSYDQWETLERSGAVFLPLENSRINANLTYNSIFYWAADCGEDLVGNVTTPYCVAVTKKTSGSATQYTLQTSYGMEKYYGGYVRLVKKY